MNKILNLKPVKKINKLCLHIYGREYNEKLFLVPLLLFM